MRKLSDFKLEELAGLSFPCGCGATHEIATKHIVLAEGAMQKLPALAAEILPAGKVLVATAEDVYGIAASPVVAALREAGYTVLTHVFPARFLPSLTASGELFSYPEDVRLVVAVGSGSVTDTVRYFASVKEIPFFSVPTAPSMDGYCSVVAPLYVNGLKESFEAAPPYAVIADLDLIATAPRAMVAAGFGDLMAKYIALYDWYFAYAVNGERYCSDVADMVTAAVENCLAVADGLGRGERGALAALTEALLRSSAAMQLLGSSRCASGGEHHVAHVLEMMAVAAGKKPRLHGEWVFFSARKLVDVYALFVSNRLDDTAFPPDKGLHAEAMAARFGVSEHEVLTKLSGGADAEQYELRRYRLEEYRDDLSAMLEEAAPKVARANKAFKRIYEDLGYGIGRSVRPEDFKAAMALAPDIREKFTTLTHMRDMGLLDGYLR